MLLQVKNRVFLLEAVSYASIVFPSANADSKAIELALVIDGYPLTLKDDEALIVWSAISQNAVSIEPDRSSAPALRFDRAI